MIKVMLVCGGGASSGFLATSMRKAARKKGVTMDIFAKSESEVEHFKDEIQVLLVGPHLEYLSDEIAEKLVGTDVIMSIIEKNIYGALDGEKAVEKVLNLMEERNNE